MMIIESQDTRTAPSKAGTFDTIVGADGREAGVYIVEDGPARMVVRVVDSGQVLHLTKAVQ